LPLRATGSYRRFNFLWLPVAILVKKIYAARFDATVVALVVKKNSNWQSKYIASLSNVSSLGLVDPVSMRERADFVIPIETLTDSRLCFFAMRIALNFSLSKRCIHMPPDVRHDATVVSPCQVKLFRETCKHENLPTSHGAT
jgi:hypothetical protein